MKPWVLALLIVAIFLDLLLAGATLSVAGFASEASRGGGITPEAVIALALPVGCLLCAVAAAVLVARQHHRAGLAVALVPVVLALALAPWLAF